LGFFCWYVFSGIEYLFGVSRHPEAPAKRASKGDGGTASERASFEARF
jgi:hypothetical protein